MSATAENLRKLSSEPIAFGAESNQPAVAFPSILFRGEPSPSRPPAPEAMVDLGLDQVIAAITHLKEEYDLAPVLAAPLATVGAISYRHEIMKDLERPDLQTYAKAFANGMRAVRTHLACAAKVYDVRQKERWFLDSAEVYCQAVDRLAADLRQSPPQSSGLRAFQEALALYAGGPVFAQLKADIARLKADLATIRYLVHMNGLHVQVWDYAAEPDYSAEIDTVFDRFKQGAAETYEFKFTNPLDMTRVESQVLAMAAKLHPEIFAAQTRFAETYRDYLDPAVQRFDRELQFYIAYLDHIAPLRRAGLPFCYPSVRDDTKEIWVKQGFDLALANKLKGENTVPVGNDFHLTGPERIIVVTGPNQGGKTTFARMFGQLHYLASLGLPVPGADAQLFLFDQLFAQFERGENTRDQRGKLQDDLIRIHEILEQATGDSVIVMNEIFTSTTLRDALELSKRVMRRIQDLGLLSVWVTFIDELASFNEATVSMVSTVDPQDPARRTFQILRRPADGLSHAVSIAERHRLTYLQLKDRLSR